MEPPAGQPVRQISRYVGIVWSDTGGGEMFHWQPAAAGDQRAQASHAAPAAKLRMVNGTPARQ